MTQPNSSPPPDLSSLRDRLTQAAQRQGVIEPFQRTRIDRRPMYARHGNRRGNAHKAEGIGGEGNELVGLAGLDGGNL